ncbi:MAG: hypothetical protein MJK12_01285 [Colwellia sp.]|nr:hypothetical protein [Colwellia sp.]
MKIDKSKLNTLLRSGLNPEIKTRKQLAAQLGLDSTSLTRWFATRDRLGNPRYPVIPDRHVTKILALFNLSPQSLSLDDEEFRHHCFELSLQYKKGQHDLREKNVALRKLSIEEYSAANNRTFPLILVITLLSIGIVWYFISGKRDLVVQSVPSVVEDNVTKTRCWTGFSSALGNFEQQDDADPCHYGKLFHQAMKQLKVENQLHRQSQKQPPLQPITKSKLASSQNYLLFLSEQLDQRRLNDKINLNVELGKSQLHRLNYAAAQNHFKVAANILASSANPDPKMLAKIAALNAQIKVVLK